VTDERAAGSLSPAQIEPFELSWRGGTVRGYRWPGDRNAILLLHDVGQDLDAWSEVPAALSAEGYGVVAVDLPGHGLSDDPWDAAEAPVLIEAIAAELRSAGAVRCFAIAVGPLAAAALTAAGVDAIVALSPAPLAEPPSRPTPPALVLVGGGDAGPAREADRFFRDTRGWAVFSSFGTSDQGSALYAGTWGGHALEQTLAFLNDYRARP
jgi:pimeloyl-ACP methyl ester carboxylesterase